MSARAFVTALFLVPTVTLGAGFNPAQSQLPAHYAGMEFPSVLKSAEKLAAIKKGEFETNADFEERKHRALSQPFHKGLSANDTFAFSLTPATFRISYDPDNEEFHVEVGSGAFSLNDYLCPIRASSSGGTYPAGNAFGVKVMVRRTFVQSSCFGGVPAVKLSFKAAPHIAPGIKSNLRVLLVGAIADPAFTQEYDRITPTISSPHEVSTVSRILHMQSAEVWVYDWKTGQVWSKHGDAPVANLNENTPLHSAIWRGERRTIPQIITDSPQYLNERNKFGATPLHLAVWKNDKRTVQALLDAGADKSIKDNDGQTPLDDARTKKFAAIVELLEKD